jgi:L-ascorbate metabolism protein UlaG (beta-lactamase superfamily)
VASIIAMTMNSSSPKDVDPSALRSRVVTDPVGRRSLLLGGASTALGVGVAAATAAVAPRAAEAAPARRRLTNRSATTWRWLGNAGWRVETGSQTLLVDPYLTRFDTGLAAGRFDATTALRVDAAEVRRHAAGANRVLVTHSHWDHFNDIPFIATDLGAEVFGSLTSYQLARAFNVPDSQLAVVKGGEVLNLDDLVVHVIASLHSRNARDAVLFPGHYDPAPTAPPGRICDLPEGDTLSYCIQESNGHRTYLMGPGGPITAARARDGGPNCPQHTRRTVARFRRIGKGPGTFDYQSHRHPRIQPVGTDW